VYELIPVTYTVTFVDWDGTELKTETVNKGEAATAPAAPSREGYTFTGWDTEFSDVQSDLTVTALYVDDSLPTYTVTFVDWDGTVLKTQTVNENTAAIAPAAPARAGYAFTGWDKTFSNVTSDLTVTALYEEITTYTVTFVDWNGTVLKTQTVNEGEAATAPANPSREGYTFTGWDKAFANVTSNLTVTALYEAITPTLNAIASNSFGIVLNGESFQVVGISQATPVSIYNLQGKVFMTRTAMPNESISVAHLPKGVYIVKAGSKTVRLAK